MKRKLLIILGGMQPLCLRLQKTALTGKRASSLMNPTLSHVPKTLRKVHIQKPRVNVRALSPTIP